MDVRAAARHQHVADCSVLMRSLGRGAASACRKQVTPPVAARSPSDLPSATAASCDTAGPTSGAAMLSTWCQIAAEHVVSDCARS